MYIIPTQNPLQIELFVPASEVSVSFGHMGITPLVVNKYTTSQQTQFKSSNHSMFQLHQRYDDLHYQ